MNEKENNSTILDKTKEYKFFVGSFKYQGYIKGETKTHLKVRDNFKKRIFHLPKNETVLEEVEIG